MDIDKNTAASGFFLPDLCQSRAVVFLVLVGELLALVIVLAGANMKIFDWMGLALTSLYVQWVVLLSAALLCASRRYLQHCSLPLSATLSYLLIILVAALINVLGQWILEGAVSGINGGRTFDLAELGRVIVITAVLAGIALRYFYLSQQLREREHAELQARLQALQARIRPHFLFNSMNIIASLIAVDQRAAETAVEDLATLFRASLSLTDTEVPLEKELDLCHRYVRIETLRLGDRLTVDWQLGLVPKGLKIPALSLQPLLENAIYHGIQLLPDGGTVTVSGHVENGQLWLRVDNPVHSGERGAGGGNRVAQENITHRLQALYGPEAGLAVESEETRYQVSLHYPLDAALLQGLPA